MGTRSITHIYEMQELGGGIICSFYRHWDGYPSEHGMDLINWLKDKQLVNGISMNVNSTKFFNRAGTMAVKLMNHIQDLSGAEIIPTGAEDYGEEYTYHVRYDGHRFVVTCQNYYGKFVEIKPEGEEDD